MLEMTCSCADQGSGQLDEQDRGADQAHSEAAASRPRGEESGVQSIPRCTQAGWKSAECEQCFLGGAQRGVQGQPY